MIGSRLATSNPDLVDIVQSHLVPEFRCHGKHGGRTERAGEDRPAYFDPWWWPIDPANSYPDWGLLPHQTDEFLSLCDVKVNGRKWPGFTGSLGARQKCVWVIGERPSFDNVYGNVVRFLRQKLPLVSALPELADFLGGSPDFHITDLIKFRGDPGRPKENISRRMIHISLECLQAEFEVLDPAMILITDFAERLLPFVGGGQNGPEVPLAKIVNHPIKIVVPFWSRLPHDEWARLVAGRLRVV